MKFDEIVLEFRKKGVDLDEYGQGRILLKFSDKIEGVSSPLTLFVGLSVGYLSVALSCNGFYIVEPFRRKIEEIENVPQVVAECIEIAHKLKFKADALIDI